MYHVACRKKRRQEFAYCSNLNYERVALTEFFGPKKCAMNQISADRLNAELRSHKSCSHEHSSVSVDSILARCSVPFWLSMHSAVCTKVYRSRSTRQSSAGAGSFSYPHPDHQSVNNYLATRQKLTQGWTATARL